MIKIRIMGSISGTSKFSQKSKLHQYNYIELMFMSIVVLTRYIGMET